MQDSQIDINRIIANLIEDNTKNMIETFTGGIKNKAKDKIKKIQIGYKIPFQNYLKKSYEKYSKIKTLLYRTEPKYLYDFFECNHLLYDRKIIDPIDINNLLEISNFLIVKGTGGIGKSTLMKHLFINGLKKGEFIPIFFELKDFNSFEGDLMECIFNSISNLGCELDKQYFEYAMKKGDFLILLDGYDEISNSKIEQFSKDFEKMCDKYDKNNYIMSSRPNEDFIAFQRFTVLSSCEFSKEKAIGLIQKLDYDLDTKERFISELDCNLYDKHRSFASNPLLLTIMLMTYNEYAEIPDKLHIFYAQAFDTLYTKHDATKSGYKRELKSKLTSDQFMKIFSKFCFSTYMKEKLEFTQLELESTFDTIKKQGLTFDNDKFLQDLVSSICLMYHDGKVYRFTHRSFQEYFTAKYILDLDDDSQKLVCRKLINYRMSDTVLDMLFDMAKERFEKNVVIPYLEEIKENCIGDEFEYYFEVLYGGIVLRKRENEILVRTRLYNIFLLSVIRKILSK